MSSEVGQDQGAQNTINRQTRGFPGGSVVKNCPPVSETQDPSLIWEDATHLRAAKPVYHDDWACAQSPGAAATEAHAAQEKPPQWAAWAPQPERNPCPPWLEKSPHSKEDRAHQNK